MTLLRHLLLLLLRLASKGSAQDEDPWVTRLASGKYEIRESAKQELVAMGLDCLPIASELLGSGNHRACRSVVDVLGRLGPPVIPFLMSVRCASVRRLDRDYPR